MDESPVESFRIRCPHCQTTLTCPAALVERSVRCPKCGKQFRVGSQSSPQSLPPPPSPPPPPPPPPRMTEIRSKAPEFVDAQSGADGPSDAPFIRTSNKLRRSRRVAKTRQHLFVIGLLGVLVLLLALSSAGYFVASSSDGAHSPSPEQSR